ncbi:MAG: hypothetical protein K9L86_01700 [Candidatus Omnitrophica bacterium]|nr:hypothetical protein [Candidatus Omnitrophota bacterium]
MKEKKWLIIVLVSLIYLTTAVSSFAEVKIPKRLIKESKDFLESQITIEDKLFLDRLHESLISLSEINQETINLVDASLPTGKKHYKKITRNIRNQAKKSNHKLLGPKNPTETLSSFMQQFLPEAANPQRNLNSLMLGYKTCQEIDSYLGDELKDTIFSEGAYHYYKRCLESFENSYGENFQELLQSDIAFYSHLSSLAKQHEIEELKKIIASSIQRIETAQQLIRTQLIDRIELSNRSWAQQIIINGLTLLQKQLQLNKQLNLALSRALNEIPTPKPVQLPDFTVSSIEVVMPPVIKVGSIIKVIADIKNNGDLTSERTRALIIFPNGSKNGRPVPKLLAHQSSKVAWRYKIRRKGKHEFNVIANYDQRTWEANPNNNTTSRILTIPH